MKTITITVAIAAALSLSGCASTSTMTNRDQTYSGHPSRIFIVSNLGKLGDSFENELQRQMLTDIQGCGGAAVFERVNPTELNSNERRNRVEQFVHSNPIVDNSCLRAGGSRCVVTGAGPPSARTAVRGVPQRRVC
jgi:hypothetical protein